jgi:PAS domain S-box-containing protein
MCDQPHAVQADEERSADLAQEAEYDRTVAEISGQKRLREVEQLNRHIAARRRSECALRESEQRFRLIAQSTSDIFYEWDIESGTVQWLGDVDSALGYAAGEIRHTLKGWLGLIHPEDRPAMDEAVLLHTETTQPIQYTYRVICNDGSVRYWRDNSSPLINYDGKPRKWVGGISDITESKRADEALIHAQRLSAIGELASGVAHDFNNALQGISGNIELALLREVAPQVRVRLEAIRNSVFDAASRIKHLERFSRSGKCRSGYVPLQVNGLVEDAILQTQPLWKDACEREGIQIEIARRYARDELRVDADAGELRSVLYNIIRNSIQAMPRGGSIIFDTGETAGRVAITITDTGIGMDEATRVRVFEPFFTTKGYEQGKGLGMSTAYAIVKEHGGGISVKHSLPGKGTTIEILLPYSKSGEGSPGESAGGEAGSARVLWVDDEEMVRTTGKELLEWLHHHADVAASGEEALRLLRDNRYDLLITDIGMPHMNGWQLAERIRGEYPEMRLAAVTGWGADVSNQIQEAHGVGYVLAKPLAMDQLRDLVNDVLRLKQGPTSPRRPSAWPKSAAEKFRCDSLPDEEDSVPGRGKRPAVMGT